MERLALHVPREVEVKYIPKQWKAKPEAFPIFDPDEQEVSDWWLQVEAIIGRRIACLPSISILNSRSWM